MSEDKTIIETAIIEVTLDDYNDIRAENNRKGELDLYINKCTDDWVYFGSMVYTADKEKIAEEALSLLEWNIK